MKITKQQLKKIIKETLMGDKGLGYGSGPVGSGEEMSPESQALFEEGKVFFAKLIDMGKNDHPDAGVVLDALGEWVSDESYDYVKIRHGY
tara:strand:- start:44 stop:313 length:270 start_codon:yes stop_codon:yes gene_type:complete